MAEICEVEQGHGRRILVVVAHADDLALFLGGTIARWSDAGWIVVAVRVTDDRWDSVGLTEGETIARNRNELQCAADALGISEVVDLGYPTDVLGDASEVDLREQIIRLIRQFKPYALVTFDPYSMYGEDNQDHKMVAVSTDEAFWTSQFDLHHPEHFADGLKPHGCFERWYFGRRVVNVTDVVDISNVLSRKIDAALCHPTMLTNMLSQLRLQAETGGWRLPMVDEALSSGDLRRFAELLVRRRSQPEPDHGLQAYEEFRVVRFGGLQPLLEIEGQRITDPA
jgi:LmbE family N-acetylglucosaminyl deacetylase